MADHRDPQIAGPAPIAPKKPLPGQGAYFPSQPPIVDIDEGSREPKRPTRPSGSNDNENPDDGSRDRSEGGHIESAEHVERELPAGDPDR